HIQSSNGPDTCIIDCESTTRGILFANSENEKTIIEGITIKNGLASDSGGAIYCDNASPTIIDCTITDSTTTSDYGGGIYLKSSNSVIKDCLITNNSADYGGGVFCDNASKPTITHCAFSMNKASNHGGGIYSGNGSTVKITNCRITSNEAIGYHGGGMYITDTNATITNCEITKNTATYNGGGVQLRDNTATIVFNNCTIANNTAGDNGGGINVYTSKTTINNTIIWGNVGITAGHQIYMSGTSPTVDMKYSDSLTSSTNIGGSGALSRSNCINDNPLFVDAVNNSFDLQSSSPAINKGSNLLIPSNVTTDLNNAPRIRNAVVDMGAYEYQP
ncbi:MAG: right-handed parallel beta-helix repeat-containing protein, partial [Planctomycetota bacterium]